MPLTAIEDFRTKAKEDQRFAKLADLCEKHDNLWNLEAETYLIETFKVVD